MGSKGAIGMIEEPYMHHLEFAGDEPSEQPRRLRETIAASS